MKCYIIKTNYSFCDEDGCESYEEVHPYIFLRRESAEEKLKGIGHYSSGDTSHYGYSREIQEWEIIE